MSDSQDAKFGTDMVHLEGGNNSTINSSLTVGLSNEDVPNHPWSELGLGMNSSFLEELYQSGTIASRSYAYYAGLDNDVDAEGSLVVGGYVAAAVASSTNLTLPIASDAEADAKACPSKLLLTISDIRLSWSNGTSTSILQGNLTAGVSACIVLAYSFVAELDPAINGPFLSKSGLTQTAFSKSPLSWDHMLIEAGGTFEGEMSFVLNHGDLNVTIPNKQLITPEYDINDQGQLYEVDPDQNKVLALNQQDPTDNGKYQPGERAALLGTKFFSSAYILCDHDRKTFTIANVQAPRQQNFVNIPATSPTCQSTPSASSNTLEAEEPDKGLLSKGAIAGAVVGAVAGLAAVVTLLFLLARKRQRSSKAVENPASSPEYKKAQLPSGLETLPPQEMPLTTELFDVSRHHEMDGLNGNGGLEIITSPHRAGFLAEMPGHTEVATQNTVTQL